jgi:hypothetical protein
MNPMYTIHTILLLLNYLSCWRIRRSRANVEEVIRKRPRDDNSRTKFALAVIIFLSVCPGDWVSDHGQCKYKIHLSG